MITGPFYLYAQPNGIPDVSPYELQLALFPGYTFVGKYDTRPNVDGKLFLDGEFRTPGLPYSMQRAQAYPAIGDQLDALWKLIGTATDLPAETRDMLTKIQEVKNAYPKVDDTK